MEEAEAVAREVLQHERGLCDVTVTDTEPALALARFESRHGNEVHPFTAEAPAIASR